MVPEPARCHRFARDLDALIPSDARFGVAVSGGPDSLALLLLAAASRPGAIEAATVDHGLRDAGRCEAEMVASVCQGLDVPHRILTIDWPERPATAIQERARRERYGLLANWARERRLSAIATGHHADDQAETLLMRLARGCGVRGLGGMRPAATVPGSDFALIRPLLGWRHAELVELCRSTGLEPAEDDSNSDEQFERIRVRRSLAQTPWLDGACLAASAAHLRDANAALGWAADQEWARRVTEEAAGLTYRPADAPREIRRRIVTCAIDRLATEGCAADLRGRELDQLLDTLSEGRQCTLRGVQCSGGSQWQFVPAKPRRD